jgi:hypothetical protein
VWVAILAGLLLSSALFTGSRFTPNYFLYWLQAIGLYTCMVIRGVHTATKADFATIAIPVNAAIYALVVFGLMRFRAKRSTSNAPAGRAKGPNSW